MTTCRIAGQEHLLSVELEFFGMDCQIIQCCGAIGQFVRDIRDPVVYPILYQYDIVALPEENGCEATVVLSFPGNIETAVDVDENGILTHIRSRVIDIQYLFACSVVCIRDGEFLLQRVGIGWFRRYLVGPG